MQTAKLFGHISTILTNSRSGFTHPKTPFAEGQPMEIFGADSGGLLMWSDIIIAREPEYLEYTFII